LYHKKAKTGSNRPKTAKTDGMEKFMIILPQIGKEPLLCTPFNVGRNRGKTRSGFLCENLVNCLTISRQA